jgi:hypothetical protein
MKEVELYAVNLIKACWRGYQDRLNYNKIRCLHMLFNSIEVRMKHCNEDLMYTTRQMKFTVSVLGLTRFQIKNKVATTIQALWRGYQVRHKKDSISDPVWHKIAENTWEYTNFSETRVFHGPVPPLSLRV